MSLDTSNTVIGALDANNGADVEGYVYANLSAEVGRDLSANLLASVGISGEIPQVIWDHLVDYDNPHQTSESNLIKNETYSGTIQASGWVLMGAYYYYNVSATVHGLGEPYVDHFMVINPEGRENCIYSYTVMPNNDIRFRSSNAVSAWFIIKGEK